MTPNEPLNEDEIAQWRAYAGSMPRYADADQQGDILRFLATIDTLRSEVQRLSEELRVQTAMVDAFTACDTLTDKEFGDFMHRCHKARLIGEAARADDEPITANPYGKFDETDDSREAQIAADWEYGWRAQNCIESGHKEEIGRLQAAIRKVWPHLTGHCFEGATPPCFRTMRDTLAEVVPDLPYATGVIEQAAKANGSAGAFYHGAFNHTPRCNTGGCKD